MTDDRRRRTGRPVSRQSTATADRGFPFVATIELLEDTLSGLRRAQAPGYTLMVLAGPFRQLSVLKALLPEMAVYRCASPNPHYFAYGCRVLQRLAEPFLAA